MECEKPSASSVGSSVRARAVHAVDMFYDVLNADIRDYIPPVTLRRRFPPRFDADVRRAKGETQFSNELKHKRNQKNIRNFEDKRQLF